MRSYLKTTLIITLWLSCGVLQAEPGPGNDAAAMRRAAHETRAVWNGFPGFTADIAISEGDVSYRGRIRVTPDFKYELMIDEKAKQAWVVAKLRSVIGHRKPSPARDYDVSFADHKPGHVSGRLVKENSGAGTFRIKDGLIREVIRKSDSSWFEISNLEHLQTHKGKYLPRTTSVTYRDPATGDLLSNRSNFFGWKRVGDFNLPARTFTIETSSGGKRTVRAITFSSQELLDAANDKEAAR